MSIENNTENAIKSTNDRVQIYANKLDKIAESFNITTSTLDGITNEVNALPEYDIDEFEGDVENPLDLILNYNMVKEDFNMVRKNLKNLIENSDVLLSNIQATLVMEGELSPDNITSFTNVGGLINNSMKMLLTNYHDLLKIEEKIKDRKGKQPNKQPTLPSIGGGNQIIIATNTADLIAGGLIK